MSSSTQKQEPDKFEDRMEQFHPREFMPPIIRDGYTQIGQIVWNEGANRIEIFPPNGGWFGLNADGTWCFDCAPFAG